MKYVGGKSRIAKYIAPIILKSNPQVVIEPFCGSLYVSCELVKLNPNLIILSSDIDSDLINMWKDVKSGWLPPENLSKEEYYELKSSDSTSLRTFAGYGCSFAGKWFGGYAQIEGRNYCAESLRSILKKKLYIKNINFSYGNYKTKNPTHATDVIYCDPPYINTLKPGKRNNFDHNEFWEWVKQQTVAVYVSEYTAPDFMECVWFKEVKTDMNTKTGKGIRIEKLFYNGK